MEHAAQNAQKAAQSVVELCRRRLPAFTGQDVFTGIQVLAPMRKGEAGVNSLNEMLQEAINPPEAGKPGKKAREEAPEQPKKGLFSRLFGK